MRAMGRKRKTTPAPVAPAVSAPAATPPAFRAWAAAIIVVALLLRLLVLWQTQTNDPFADRLLPDGDEHSFQRWAERIADGDVRGDGYYVQAPLYPYAMAALFAASGKSLMAMRAAQALLDAGTTGLVIAFGTRLLPPGGGLLAGALYALHPVAWFFPTRILRDSPMPFLFMLVLLLAVRAEEKKTGRCWFAAGCALGLAHLCRENVLTLTALLAGWTLWRRYPVRQALLPLLAGALLLLSPVGLRNLSLGLSPFTITQNGAVALVMGNAADASGVGYIVPPSNETITPQATGLWSTARGILATYDGIPFGLGPLYLRKVHGLLTNLEIANNENFYLAREHSMLLHFPYGFGAVWLLALAGIAVVLTQRTLRQRHAVPLLLGAVYAATVLLFFQLARFRLPLLPLLCVYAALLLQVLPRLRRDGKRAVLAGGVAALTAAAAFIPTAYERAHGTQLPREQVTRAQLAMAAQDWNAATALLQQALAAEPGNATAHLKLGIVRQQQGDTVAAQAAYAQALALNPNLFEAWMNIGGLLLEQQNYRDAAEHFATAARLQPQSALAWRQQGIALLLAGDPRGAVPALQQALACDPSDQEVAEQLEILKRAGIPAVLP